MPQFSCRNHGLCSIARHHWIDDPTMAVVDLPTMVDAPNDSPTLVDHQRPFDPSVDRRSNDGRRRYSNLGRCTKRLANIGGPPTSIRSIARHHATVDPTMAVVEIPTLADAPNDSPTLVDRQRAFGRKRNGARCSYIFLTDCLLTVHRPSRSRRLWFDG